MSNQIPETSDEETQNAETNAREPKVQAPSLRTTIKRIPSNANNEQEFLHAIIDDAYVCHVAFTDEHGTHCIPTACWREQNHLYIHGANASRMIKQLVKGTQACITITHIDGLVLARSAFNHSMNYRSAMIYGTFEVLDAEQKAASMAAFMDRIAPGRQAEVRAGSYAELAGTTILRMPLVEFICKMRSGGPNDDEEDMQQAAWAGVLPLRVTHDAPIPHEQNTQAAPAYVNEWKK